MNTRPRVDESKRGFGRCCAAALISAGSLRCARAGILPSRPALLLAREADAQIDPAGFLVSEKYDGVRAWWDGTQLRFRSGRSIHAPDWFLARLPSVPLDGELWLGRGRFEALSGSVRREVPDDMEWSRLSYMVFELPGAPGDFATRATRLSAIVKRTGWQPLQAVEQRPVADRAALQRWLEQIVSVGGEGLVLHRADAPYLAGRGDALLKLKPLQDAEAIVLAHVPGRGRHAGRLGALQVRNEEGAVFAIGTGFSDAQREAPPAVGTVVTYNHRGATRFGVPRFASFLRTRPAE